jgi:signal transduction histidine kinase
LGVNSTSDSIPFDDAHRDLEQAARLVVAGELVASITHDLRQPLTAIEMNVAAALRLLEKSSPQDAAPDASRASEAIAALRDALAEQRRMREALQVLQDLAAMREPSFGPVNVDTCVREVVRLVSSEAFARHIRIDIVSAGGVLTISADEALLRQALLNLLIDALEATTQSERGQGPVVVEIRPFRASAVDVVVTHYGVRREAAAVDGWGLALARSVATAHGASLTMTGDPIGGISVVTRWPVAARAAVGDEIVNGGRGARE